MTPTPVRFRALFGALAVLLGLALFDALASDAQAGMGSFFSGLATRSRVVQVCIVTMAIALFIMFKKFAPDGRDRGAFAPNVNYAERGRGGDASPRA